jgi:hypothetical protein
MKVGELVQHDAGVEYSSNDNKCRVIGGKPAARLPRVCGNKKNQRNTIKFKKRNPPVNPYTLMTPKPTI